MRVLVRVDDFTPNRNTNAWQQIEGILDRLQIKPLVACVPDDKYFGSAPTTEEFWREVRGLQSKGWAIGLHGETHQVSPIAPGANREIFFAKKSEFVGLPQDLQVAKLTRAWNEFVRNGVRPVAFVPPNHGFDASTVRALCKHGKLEILSDGIALRVFRDRELIWLPQIDWRVPRLRFGFRTVCLHPSTMSAAEIQRFDADVTRIRASIVSIDDITAGTIRLRGLLDVVFERFFAAYFNLKQALYR